MLKEKFNILIYCFDTFYSEGFAKTAVVGIEDWGSHLPAIEFADVIDEVSDYESGAFYKRELPCILSVLDKINLDCKTDILIVDGFVVLSDEGKLGLGGYLFNKLNTNIPVIGVAKNDFVSLNKLKRKVYRGDSKKPLYITALGYDLEKASEKIRQMHGDFRIPTILKLVDQKCRL